MIRLISGGSVTALMWVVLAPAVRAADAEAIDRAIDRGVAYLKAIQQRDGRWPLPGTGATALAGLTLLECRVPADDPAVQKAAAVVRDEGPGVQVTYALAAAILFLDRLGERRDGPLIELLGVRLLAGQNRIGGWSYSCPSVGEGELRRLKNLFRQRNELVARGDRLKGAPPAVRDPSAEIQVELARLGARHVAGPDDNSNTQFAILGLWAARRQGVPVDMALERVKARFKISQNADGGWGYGTFYGEGPASTYSMTCAGLLGLACAHGSYSEGLERREKAAVGGKDRSVVDAATERAMRKGLLGLGAGVGRPLGVVGPTEPPLGGYQEACGVDATGRVGREYAYYFLWSLERVAVAYSLKTIGKKDWYDWGARALLATQHRDGSWRGACALGGADTCFALLFLRRANLTPDLSARLAGLVKDPGESVLRVGGFGGDKMADAASRLPDSRSGDKPAPPAAPGQGESPEPAGRRAPSIGPAAPPDDEGARLSQQLLQAPVALQKTLLLQFRDARGPTYTAALAQAIPKLGGEVRRQARDALAERLTRMTAATLGEKLRDPSAEVRRAAALACALKQEKSHFLGLIALLEDREAEVARAARVALKSLSSADHGPPANASPAERARAIAAWKAWWQKHGESVEPPAK